MDDRVAWRVRQWPRNKKPVGDPIYLTTAENPTLTVVRMRRLPLYSCVGNGWRAPQYTQPNFYVCIYKHQRDRNKNVDVYPHLSDRKS